MSEEERERPYYWRFWRVLPSRGRIGILFGSWYTDPIIRHVYGEIKRSRLDRELVRISFFENMLVDDGALIIKLWFHLSKKELRKRLRELETDPRKHWRILPTDWKHYRLYDNFILTTDRVIRRTDCGAAPWHIIEATDPRYRDLTAGRVVLVSIQRRLRGESPSSKRRPAAGAVAKNSFTILDHVDLSQSLSVGKYRKQLEKYQGRLGQLTWRANRKRLSSVVVFEGWDAAGKGSGIRRVTQAIDPRLFRVVSIAAPTDEERAHHYLWRFWRHLPKAGMITVFDRSWYGRVLVERVEGFVTAAEWSRAYLETNEFEEQLSEHGIILTKFWIHISKEEQLRRFREREKTPYKLYKITDEDWRNRKKRGAYEDAVHEMFARTNTEISPWVLVAGDDKRVARIQILTTLCRNLEQALE